VSGKGSLAGERRFRGMLTIPLFLIVAAALVWSVWYAVQDEELF
jgi:hypothetical protein